MSREVPAWVVGMAVSYATSRLRVKADQDDLIQEIITEWLLRTEKTEKIDIKFCMAAALKTVKRNTWGGYRERGAAPDFAVDNHAVTFDQLSEYWELPKIASNQGARFVKAIINGNPTYWDRQELAEALELKPTSIGEYLRNGTVSVRWMYGGKIYKSGAKAAKLHKMHWNTWVQEATKVEVKIEKL